MTKTIFFLKILNHCLQGLELPKSAPMCIQWWRRANTSLHNFKVLL